MRSPTSARPSWSSRCPATTGATSSSGCHTQEEVITACGAAGAGGRRVLVERYIPGSRLPRPGRRGPGRRRRPSYPARVTGDGISEIAALVDQVNAEPGGGSDTTGPSPGSSSTTPR